MAIKSERADIEQLRKMVETVGTTLNLRPMIAFTMKNSGASYREIGEVFGVSRQMANTLVDQMNKELA